MKGFNPAWPALVVLLAAGLVLAACAGAFPAPGSGLPGGATPTYTPFQPVPATAVPGLETAAPETPSLPPQVEATAEGEAPPVQETAPEAGTGGLWLAPYLPQAMQQEMILLPGLDLAPGGSAAGLRLEVGEHTPVSRWVYALAAPFPTIIEQVAFNDIRRAWSGEPSGPFSGRPLLVDASTLGVFTAWWGEPPAGAVQALPTSELLEYAWNNRPSWAILPFEALEPRWKALAVDGQSPVRKDFDPAAYPLSVPFSLTLAPGYPADVAEMGRLLSIPAGNRDPGRMTTLVMSGVTAMVRCTAYTMEQRGMTYPAGDIRDILVNADLAHISNEIPFEPGCPFPSCTQAGLVFCSDPRYIELMEDIGTDIVELTGDHFADWGPEAMHFTLDMYRERGWSYYGGGANRDEARRPLLVEHNGNRLAFIGCNGKASPGYATASETQPGAVSCDFAYINGEIERLLGQGYLPIVTFQHEEYYRNDAAPRLVEDFGTVAEAGAVIVSGSQAHQPHGMAFSGRSFIHYGLGNLFFDQFGYCIDDACSRAFIDRHVFYDGRYISAELLPIQFVDFARSRPMTEDERTRFLELMFAASGW